jgi:hypothetical protein
MIAQAVHAGRDSLRTASAVRIEPQLVQVPDDQAEAGIDRGALLDLAHVHARSMVSVQEIARQLAA